MATNNQYINELNSIPAPGGHGCHPFLLRVANLARAAGLAPESAFADIRSRIPQGTRIVSDGEICDAIEKGFSTECPEFRCRSQNTTSGLGQSVDIDYELAFHSIVKDGLPLVGAGGLREMSPVAIPEAEMMIAGPFSKLRSLESSRARQILK